MQGMVMITFAKRDVLPVHPLAAFSFQEKGQGRFNFSTVFHFSYQIFLPASVIPRSPLFDVSFIFRGKGRLKLSDTEICKASMPCQPLYFDNNNFHLSEDFTIRRKL